ncbi:hypothetical protein F907_02666 [Acinetobacter colistiniresistens]|uniref:Uncharacterized protein n=1 Tax=Acinetobacter colistiniresistens TaxID=280145 RepID=S3T8X1_9GAMM|nr:hypothetical protein F907_02666 [Acinetobacter colistiniresistens]
MVNWSQNSYNAALSLLVHIRDLFMQSLESLQPRISVAPMMDWTSEILFIFQIKDLLKNFKILGVK